MSLAEFLDWDDGTDTRYELVAGRVLAMAPPAGAHSIIVGNLVRQIGARLSPPCYVAAEAGVVPPERSDTFYQADIVVSCTALPRGGRWIPEPVLIAEVLSPSTTMHDLQTKLPDYQRTASVILLVASEERRVELWRRIDAVWNHERFTGEQAVAVEGVADELPLAAIYANVPF